MKPHPEYYRIALERFCLKPEECFFLDDVPLLRSQLRAAGVMVRE